MYHLPRRGRPVGRTDRREATCGGVEWTCVRSERFVVVVTNNIRVDVGDWSPDPVFGGQQFQIYPPGTPGYPHGGRGQGGFLPFTP
jgi:hypothetical protein